VELDAVAQRERVREPVARDRPGLREIAHDLAAILADLHEQAVERRERVDRREAVLAVPVPRRRFGADGEDQRAAAPRLLCGGGEDEHDGGERDDGDQSTQADARTSLCWPACAAPEPARDTR
jgi:hypothetical protein